MFQVIKRDGSKADFTLTKINDAIMKAFTATQMSYNNDIIDLLALRVTADFQKKVENDEIHVEDIQDSVERVIAEDARDGKFLDAAGSTVFQGMER